MNKFIVFLLLGIIAFVGCSKKETPPVPVGEMTEYKDLAFGFKIGYPKEWKQLGNSGKALFVKSQEVASKFLDPASGEEGGQVTVESMPLSGRTPEAVIDSAKGQLKQAWASVETQADQQVTVGGKPGVKVGYSIPVTSKTKITGYEIYVAGDTAVYKLDFIGYGDQFTAHAGVFDAMLKSFVLPVVMIKSNTWGASPTLETYKSDFLTMQYPENMEFVPGLKKGDKDLVVEMKADRNDCSIHLDVFGAKNLTTEKVWEQNKGKYKAKATGNVMIDGNKAYWVDYTPMKDVTSRAYFVVKNDKVVRITMNWFAPQKDVYLPVFEKAIASIKLK